MIVAVATPLVGAAEVLLLVFAGRLFAVLLSSLADALVRMSPMRRGLAFGLTVVFLTATVGVGWALWPSISEQADHRRRGLRRAGSNPARGS
jgi:predicted PurR-regulated permease PerM